MIQLLRKREYSDDPASAWVRALSFTSWDHFRCFTLRFTKKSIKISKIRQDRNKLKIIKLVGCYSGFANSF